MTVIISGSAGIQNPLGSAAAPSESNTTNSNTGAYFPTGTTYGIATNGSNAMYINASQNVGIGTTSPSYPLSISKTTVGGSVWANVNNTDTTSGSTAGYFASNGSVNAVMFSSSFAGTGTYGMTTNHPALFITNNTERMRLDTSGSLLIGTTSTGAKGIALANGGGYNYSVAEGSGESYFNLFRQSNSAATVIANGYKYSGTANSFASSVGTSWAKAAISVNSGNVIFYTDTAATVATGTDVTPTERMRIDSSGNLLVGTTDAGTASGPGIKFLPSTTIPNASLVYNTTSGSVYGWMMYNTNATNNGYRFYVGTDGGIRNYSANNVNLSDARLKTDISPAGNYLDKICAIPVKTFKFKDQGDDPELTLGVIAQDVEVIAPELVNNDGFGETPEDGVPYKTIYQTDLQYALMKAIQEQQAIIQELSAEVTALKAKVGA